MTDAIDEYTKELSSASQKSYRTAYLRLNKLMECNNCEECESDDIINCLKNCDANIHSKLAMLNIPICLAKKNKPNNFSFNQMEKFREQLRDEATKFKINKNKEKKDGLPSLSTLNEFTKNLYNDKKYEEYIVNYLLLNFNCRNADLLIKIVNTTKDIIPELNYNYLIVRDTYIEFRRFNYKTAFKYGTKNKRFKSVKLKTAINELLKKRGKDDGCFLLLDNSLNPYVEENIGSKIRRMTYNEIGEGNYLKVIILDIQNKEPQKLINKLQGISENRGTALDILTKDYNISFEQQ